MFLERIIDFADRMIGTPVSADTLRRACHHVVSQSDFAQLSRPRLSSYEIGEVSRGMFIFIVDLNMQKSPMTMVQLSGVRSGDNGLVELYELAKSTSGDFVAECFARFCSHFTSEQSADTIKIDALGLLLSIMYFYRSAMDVGRHMPMSYINRLSRVGELPHTSRIPSDHLCNCFVRLLSEYDECE